MTQIYRYGLLCGLLYLTIAAAGSYDRERPELVAFGFDGFEPGINHLISEGDAKEKLLRRFGEPQQVESTTQWEHLGLIQTKTWRYEGLKILTMRPVEASRHWLRKITLTNPVYPLKFGLSIGATKQAFVARLGPPYHTRPDSFKYEARYYGSEDDVGVNRLIRFSIGFNEDDRAHNNVWEYYRYGH